MKKHARSSIHLHGICNTVICKGHCLSVPFLFLLGMDSRLIAIEQGWIEWSIILVALLIGVVGFLHESFMNYAHLQKLSYERISRDTLRL